MKKLILSLTLAGAAALAAKASTVSSANTFGVLKVASSAKQTIIAVPWVAVSTEQSSPIAIANLVMTSNLTVDDMLYYYNGSTYDAWQLTQESPEADKVWTSVKSVTANGITSSDNPTTTTVLRGKALILVRNNVSDPSIYLYGQYTPGTASTTVTAGTHEQNVWNLLAPSSAEDTVVSSESADKTCMTGNPSNDDYIMLSNEPAKLYKYKNGKWAYTVKKLNGAEITTYLTIPAGIGAWYVSAGGSPTFNW